MKRSLSVLSAVHNDLRHLIESNFSILNRWDDYIIKTEKFISYFMNVSTSFVVG